MKRRTALAALSFAPLMPFASAPVHGTKSTPLDARIAGQLRRFCKAYDLPGIAVGYVLPDGTLGTVAAGVADRETKLPLRPASKMLAASVGKTFVGATVLALDADAVLDVDDLLSLYLGDRDWFARLPNGGDVTLRHLLRHEAGLPDHVRLPAFRSAAAIRFGIPDRPFTPEELVGFVTDLPALFEAGQGWAYSDTGFILLGLVIEAATGRDYFDVVRERFLSPLGLSDTIPSDRPDLPDLAVGYTTPDNPFGLPPRTVNDRGHLVWNPASEWTGGGYASTAGDLARWGDALFTGRAMSAPYLDRLLDGVPVEPRAPGARYGVGVAVRVRSPRGPVYGHGGWIPGYISSLRHYADHGVTIAFMLNTDAVADEVAPLLEEELAGILIGASR